MLNTIKLNLFIFLIFSKVNDKSAVVCKINSFNYFINIFRGIRAFITLEENYLGEQAGIRKYL